MRIPKKLCTCLLAVVSSLLFGCASVGLISSDDPDKKLSDAGHLIDQGRPLPAERLIHEAIAVFRERDDPQGLGYAYGLYGEFLRSNVIIKAEVSYLRDGFRDKTVTMSNRFDKSAEYTKMGISQYELAIDRLSRSEKYDALTNAHLHLAWLHQQLMQKEEACRNFQKTLDAYALNMQRNPHAKPQTPNSGQSIPDYVQGLMHKAQCQ